MDDGEALLKAIIAQPDEDDPRLMYADWLTENGQAERGEFVRVQCEIERGGHRSSKGCNLLPGNTCSGLNGAVERLSPGSIPEWCDVCRPIARLLERERELWNNSRLNGAPHPWFGTMGFRVRVNWLSSHNEPVIRIRRGEDQVRFRLGRGFVESVATPWEEWLAHADAILAAHPVQAVTLTTRPRPALRDTSFIVRCRSDGGFVEQPPQRPFGWSLTATSAVRYLDAAGRHVDIDWPGHPNYDPNFVIDLLRNEWPTVKTWNLPPEPRPINLDALAGVRVSEATHRALARAGRLIMEAARRRNPR